MSASNKKKLRNEQKAAALTEKQNQELKEAKKLKAYTLTFAVAMVLIVAIVIGVTVTPLIQATLRRNTHAVTIGEHELTADDLTYYYVDGISAYQDNIYSQYYSYYGNYWSLMLGYDTTKALDKQIKDSEKNQSWAEFFVDQAVENAKNVYALYDDAMSKDYKLSEDEQKTLDSTLKSLETYAKQYEYSSVDDYLRSIYGKSASVEAYTNYYTITSIASSYYKNYSNSLEYEASDYRAYEKDKLHEYNNYTYNYYTLSYTSYLGEGTKNESGTIVWSDEEKNEARAKMQADMEALKAAGIKDKASFDTAVQSLEINKFDKDGKPVADDKKATAKTATKVSYSTINYTDAARDWLIHADRKIGDFDAFAYYDLATEGEEDESKKIVNGYYFILFESCDTNEVNMVNVRHILVKFTGGTKGEDGKTTYSEAEKSAAKLEAEKLLKQFTDSIANETDAAKIEEKFGELANKESDDQNGKVTNGGIYEDIYPGQMVKAFEDWCFDKDRKPGDTGLVETEYGWHVMFYSSTDEMTYRDSLIEADMRTDDLEKWEKGLIDKTSCTIVNLKYMEYDIIVG